MRTIPGRLIRALIEDMQFASRRLRENDCPYTADMLDRRCKDLLAYSIPDEVAVEPTPAGKEAA